MKKKIVSFLIITSAMLMGMQPQSGGRIMAFAVKRAHEKRWKFTLRYLTFYYPSSSLSLDILKQQLREEQIKACQTWFDPVNSVELSPKIAYSVAADFLPKRSQDSMLTIEEKTDKKYMIHDGE